MTTPTRRRRNRSNKNRQTNRAVSHKELNGFSLPPKFPIPSHSVRPTVQRTVRIITGAVPPFNLTPNVVALEDAAEYGGINVRYSTMRVVSLRVWGADPSPTVNSQVIVTFFVQGSIFPVHVMEDEPTSGAERANVGFVYPYASRGSPYSTSDTTSVIANVSNGTVTPITSFIMDVTVLFN